jgi:tetratricopeptide (TPR) repeat protein
VLNDFIQVSGNTEDIYRALCCMSECAAHMKERDTAVKFAAQAALAIPEFPQAYRLLAQWEMEDKRWEESLEWCKVADSKPLNQGFGVFDPTVKSQIYLIAMHAEFMLGNFNKALGWLRKLDKNDPARKEFEPEMLNEADAETFLAMLPKIRRYFRSDEDLFHSLVPDLQLDTRLRGLRDLVVEPKTWSDNPLLS